MLIPTDFTLEPATWEHDQEDLKRVRTAVFIVEQAIPESEEWDELDPRSWHVLARALDGTPIGTGRLTPEHKIGRMAVLRDWRGKGVGEAIVRALVERAREQGITELTLHAQTHALAFYTRCGFSAYGEEFDECGIPHRRMRMALAPREAYRPSAPLEETPAPRLIAVTDREGARAAVLELLGLARRELCLYTRDLDPLLFDTDEALEAVRRVATAGRGASVRILVQQPALPLQDGHRLLHLARRLPSVFAFRTPDTEEDLQYPSAFLLNDRRGYYFRTLGSRFEGEAHTYAPGRHAQLQEYFNQVWQRASPSQELRQLSL